MSPLNPAPSWLLAHSLGRRLLFPGSVRLLQKALLPALLQGQARLIGQVRPRPPLSHAHPL